MGEQHGDGEGHLSYQRAEHRGRDGTSRRGPRRRQTRSRDEPHRNESRAFRGLETCASLVSNPCSIYVHLRTTGMGVILVGIPVSGAVVGLLSLVKKIPLLPETLQLAGLYWVLKSQGVPIARIST
mmetsp:Transcript_12604/g.25582  ORF Transcript_12604/g.25582 Transcript_12604/m.25582 type:complete len:126 (+) Transcript_12604:367-744(+)